MDNLKNIKINITQNKFYLIVLIILIFISLQLDGINDKLHVIIELYEKNNRR